MNGEKEYRQEQLTSAAPGLVRVCNGYLYSVRWNFDESVYDGTCEDMRDWWRTVGRNEDGDIDRNRNRSRNEVREEKKKMMTIDRCNRWEGGLPWEFEVLALSLTDHILHIPSLDPLAKRVPSLHQLIITTQHNTTTQV